MALSVGSLQVDLIANTSSFTDGMNKAGNDVGKFRTKSKQELGGFQAETEYSMFEARHSILLLGEQTGVHFPRAVAGMIASVAPVGRILAAAFPLIGIVALIEIFGKAIEKIDEWREHGEKVADAWRNVANASAEVGRSMTQALDASEAKVIAFTQGPLTALQFELENIGSSSEKVAGLIGKLGTEVDKAFKESQQSRWNPFAWFMENSRDVTVEATKSFNEIKAATDQLGNSAGLDLTNKKIAEIEDKLRETSEVVKATTEDLGAMDLSSTGRTPEATEALNKQLEALKQVRELLQKGQKEDANNAAAVLIKGIELEEKTLSQRLDANKKYRDDVTELNSTLARAGADAAGADAAEIRAIDTAKADDLYNTEVGFLQRMIAIHSSNSAADIAEREKANASLQQLAITHQTALAKVEDEYNKKHREEVNKQLTLDEEADKKRAKDADELAKAYQKLQTADLELAKAETVYNDAVNKADFSAQEQKIKNLASLKIISERQAADQLRVLYTEEGNNQLTQLEALYDKEYTAYQVAQDQIQIAQKSGDEKQIAEAQAAAAKIQAIMLGTETKIVEAKGQTAQKILAIDKQAESDYAAILRQTEAGFINNLADMVTGGTTKWSDFVTSIEKDLARLALNNLFKSLFGALLSGLNNSDFFSGLGGGNLFGSGGAFAGGRASGGDVSPGSIYEVGEAGREWFVPKVAGTIVPNSKTGSNGGTGGTTVVNQTFNIHTPNADSFRMSSDQITTQAFAAASRAAKRNGA